MARTVTVTLEVNVEFTVRANVTDAQILGYLSGVEADTTTALQALVAAAPPATQAVYVGDVQRLELEGEGSTQRQLEWQVTLTVSVADAVTDEQVWAFLAGHFDEAKQRLRTLFAGAPAGADVVLQRWHIHRGGKFSDSGSGDEVEP